jgi:hypothetical protein
VRGTILPPLHRPFNQLPSADIHLPLDLFTLVLYVARIALHLAHRSIMFSSTSLDSRGDCKAYPLPAKILSWEPLHLAFRHAKLPNLPKIHDPHIWSVLHNANYERSSKPSGHSIKTLAWCGDAVLLLASTKACLKAGLNSGNHRQLQVSLSRP